MLEPFINSKTGIAMWRKSNFGEKERERGASQGLCTVPAGSGSRKRGRMMPASRFSVWYRSGWGLDPGLKKEKRRQPMGLMAQRRRVRGGGKKWSQRRLEPATFGCRTKLNAYGRSKISRREWTLYCIAALRRDSSLLEDEIRWQQLGASPWDLIGNQVAVVSIIGIVL